MFIKNPQSINTSIFMANEEQKDILLKKGKAPLSYFLGQWIFKKDKDIEEMLREGGELCNKEK